LFFYCIFNAAIKPQGAGGSVSPRDSITYNPAMAALTKTRLNVDEYLAWAEDRPGRYELLDGTMYAMAPEQAIHAKIKLAVHMALAAALRARHLPCHVIPDGMTVRIDESTAYEPDGLVYCGRELPPAALEVPNPIIAVEVISPSSEQIDTSIKLPDYFRVPSVMHYLIVDPERPLIIHHARGKDGPILAGIVREGAIDLDPPGLELVLSDIYGR
jgi:Uma2 family endonuclease